MKTIDSKTIIEVLKFLKDEIDTIGPANCSIVDEESGYLVDILSYGISLCKQNNDGCFEEEMFLEVVPHKEPTKNIE